MKTQLRILTALAFCITMLMQACSKDDTGLGVDEPQVKDTILTEQKLVGKWEALNYTRQLFDSNMKPLFTAEKVKGLGYFENGNPIGRHWWASDVSYITFNADHTYRHIDTVGKGGGYMFEETLPSSGTWSLANRETLKLSMLFASNDTAFRCRYEDGTLGMALAAADTGHADATGRVVVITFSLTKVQ